MAQETLNNGETGAVIRGKINDNFTELYTDKANDSEVVKLTGDQTIAGVKTFGNETNNSLFEADGTLVSKGAATVWDDVAGSLLGRRLYSTTGSVDYNYAENTITFERNGDINTQNDVVVFNIQLPHGARVGSEMRLHIHWEQTDADARQFTLKHRIQSNGQAKQTSWTDTVVNTNTEGVDAFPYTSGTLNQISKLVNIDMTGASISSTVQFRMTRSDNVNVDLEATFIDVHIEYDMNGSRQEFIK